MTSYTYKPGPETLHNFARRRLFISICFYLLKIADEINVFRAYWAAALPDSGAYVEDWKKHEGEIGRYESGCIPIAFDENVEASKLDMIL